MDESNFFALPPFNPESALLQLRRFLREQPGLKERGDQWECQGLPVLTVAVQDGQLSARLARRLLRQPEWDVRPLRSGADVRALQDELRRRLTQWTDD